MDNSKSPLNDSIWMRCFFEVYDEERMKRKDSLDFEEVDSRVLKYSRMPMEEFRKKFFGEG